MPASEAVENDQIICDLRDALRDGSSGLEYVPRLLRRVLETDAWRQRIDRATHRTVGFASFAEFVETRPTEGLGTSLALVRRIVASDMAALDLFDRAVQMPVGVHASRPDSDNITITDTAGGRGTSREYALRRLRAGAPEQHARVLAGELSPHAAMVAAGFRPPTFTVRGDTAQDVVRTLRRRLAPDVVAEIGRLITSGSDSA